MDLLFSIYFLGYLLSLSSIFLINRATDNEQDKFELGFALLISILSYLFVLMFVLDYMDNKLKERIPFIKNKCFYFYSKLNKLFMDIK